VIEDLAGHDDLVGAGPLDEFGEAAPHADRRANDGCTEKRVGLSTLKVMPSGAITLT